VSRYQKGKTNPDFTEARDSEWQWNPLNRMQVCISLQTDNHANTPPLKFFTGRMPFLPPNQQCQSTEGKVNACSNYLSLLPSTGREMTTSQIVPMLCGWGVKAGRLISLVDKRVCCRQNEVIPR